MQIKELPVAGCHLVQPRVFQDARGRFIKPLVSSVLHTRGLRTDFVEQYYSTSQAGVVRGMHFQIPPHDHAKLVYCSFGAVIDVLLDLRLGSPTYGQFCALPLTADSGHAVYIASGVAHGFLATEEPALMVYNVTSEYMPSHDAGVRWDSFGYQWPVAHPLISDRDNGLPGFGEFQSPFQYQPAAPLSAT